MNYVYVTRKDYAMDNYPDNMADILSTTMSIDDFISSIIDNFSSEEFNIAYVYLKGLANIDYYSINLDNNKLYVEKLTEYAI